MGVVKWQLNSVECNFGLKSYAILNRTLAALLHRRPRDWLPGRLDAVRGSNITNASKVRKIDRVSSIQATSFKLGVYNLLHSILTLRFTNCLKFNFDTDLR